jgi:RHS repeat-associated protein
MRMKYFTILVILNLFGSPLLSQNSEVIKLTGNFSVNDAGSASYSIPITLPPGIGGMKPDLSLNYSSNGGNGLLGIGWAFSGLSVIARGNRTIEQDGVAYGIQFNNDDVYYLDGERLVQWNTNASYGDDGSEYGTESNTFVKVISKGVSGNGPGYFVVFTKSNLKLTFGRSPSSKVFVPGSNNVLYYLLDKIEEYNANSSNNDSPTPNTNYISYEYEIDASNGTYRPYRIRYTQNSSIAPGSNSSLTDVLFIYDDRKDIDIAYINGIKNSITKRLSELHIIQNSIVKEVYLFYYTEHGSKNTTLLQTVMHCIAETGQCSDQLTFQWDIPQTELSFTSVSYPIPAAAIKGANKEIYVHDLNNDGLTDLIIANRTGNLSFEIYLNNGQAMFSKVNHNVSPTFLSAALNFIDVNADGFVDLVVTDSSGVNVWYINDKKISLQGANFTLAPQQILTSDLNNSLTKQFFFIDYNGDARPDFFIVNSTAGTAVLYENQSDSSNLVNFIKRTDLNSGLPNSTLQDYFIVLVDLDNDGKTDVLFHRRKGRETNGHNIWYKNTYTPGSNYVFTKIGENLIDKKYFQFDAFTSSGLNVSLANGDKSYLLNNYCQKFRNPLFKHIGSPQFADINGDGLQDIVIYIFHSDNHWTTLEGTTGIQTQVKRMFAFVNKGNFNFETKVYTSCCVYNNSNYIDFDKMDGELCYVGSAQSLFIQHPLLDCDGYETNEKWRFIRDNELHFVDLNGDGKSDVISEPKYFGTWKTPKFENDVFIKLDLNDDANICRNEIAPFGTDVKDLITAKKISDAKLTFGRFYRFGTDIYIFDTLTGYNILYKNNLQSRPPAITSFHGQLGGDFYVEYSTMNDPDVYVKGTSRSYPNIDYSSSAIIVKGYTKYDSGSMPSPVVSIQYKYFDGVLNLTGRGFRGYKKIELTDNIQGFKVVKEFEEDSRFIAANLKSQKTYALNGQLLSEEVYKNVQWETLSDGSGGIYVPFGANTFQDKIFTPFPSESISRTYDLLGSKLSENKSRMYMDAFGNVIYQVFDHGDGCIDSIYNEYINDWEKWFIGRLIKSTVYKKCPGNAEIIRESAFEYHPITGFLVKEILEPNQNEQIRTIRSYERDIYGNITKITEQAWNGIQVVTRTKTAKFDPLGRYQIESTNQLGHKVSLKVDPYRGIPIESTDENGLVTKMKYNAFGILREIEHPDGQKTFIDSENKGDWWGSSWFEFSIKGSNSALSRSAVDNVGREIESYQTIFDGTESYTSLHYNYENRLELMYHPYGFKEFEYDIAGRIIKTKESGNNNSILEYTTNYVGLSETIFNPLQQIITRVKDVRQRLNNVFDNAGNQINYQYDTQGHLSHIRLGNNEYVITYEYDLRGRMTAMTDPVLGREEFTYDGFGNLLSKKDGNGNVITYTYDELNRLKSVIQAEGTVTYTYDQGNKAIGKISKITYPNYESNLVYDNLGRLSQNIISIQGQNYVYKYSYNNIGKLDIVEHPSGIKLKYHYNTNFYLSKITNDQSGKLLWEIKKVDQKNRVTEEVHGNGATTTYQYDIQDNLTRVRSVRNNVVIHDLQYEYNAINQKTQKIDHKNNITEDYTYDNLNRLTSVNTSGQFNANLSMTYDKWGNIKTKSDLGTYHYSSSIPTLLERIDFLEPDCSLPSSKFDYEYTSFNKISKITGDSVRLEITYGPDNQRLIQRIFIHNQLRETRTYVAPDYEIITINNIDTRRMSIPGSAGMAVIYEVTGTQAGKYSYLHKDDQGSVVAITNDAGVVQYSYKYDVWGKRSVATQVENVFGGTYRGYTGHEHIAILELINMNGRIYDPVMARFLSPDPYIFETANFQNFNRFSYVFNNPVNLTDPSGFRSWRNKFKSWGKSATNTISRVGKGIGSIANGDIRDGLKYFGQANIDFYLKWSGTREIDRRGKKVFGEETWNQIVVASASITAAQIPIVGFVASGFVSGGLNSYLAGAGTNDILKSGFKGAALSAVNAGLTYGVGSTIDYGLELKGTFIGESLRALGHGAVQGTVTEIQGGKFSSGFYTGMVSSVGSHTKGLYGDNSAGRLFASSLVGGTTSVVSGGKFATGAVSGAFVEMYNNQLHPAEEKGAEMREGSRNDDKNRMSQNDLERYGYNNSSSGIADRIVGESLIEVGRFIIDHYIPTSISLFNETFGPSQISNATLYDSKGVYIGPKNK